MRSLLGSFVAITFIVLSGCNDDPDDEQGQLTCLQTPQSGSSPSIGPVCVELSGAALPTSCSSIGHGAYDVREVGSCPSDDLVGTCTSETTTTSGTQRSVLRFYAPYTTQVAMQACEVTHGDFIEP